MKKLIIGIICLLWTSLLAALDLPFLNNLALKEGTYMRVQLGATMPDDDLRPTDGRVNGVQNLSYLSNDWHLKYSIGYQVNSDVAVQLGYLNMVNLEGTSTALSPNYRANLTYWDLAARGLLALSEHFTATSILGAVYAMQKVTGSNDPTISNQNLSRFTAELGLGLKYNLTQSLDVSLEPYVIFRNGPILSSWYFPLGLTYTF